MSLLNQVQTKMKPLFDILIYDTKYSDSPFQKSSVKRHLFASPFKLKESLRASLTVEASVVLTVLIFAVVFVMINFRILAIGWGISAGATDIVRKIAVYSGVDKIGEENQQEVMGGITLVALAQTKLDKEQVPVKFINGGKLGISFLGSGIKEKDVDLKINYAVEVPIRFFGRRMFFITQRVRAKRWLGYDPREGKESDDEYVYVTKNGVAYHRNIKCPYLSPSVSMVNSENLGEKRNEAGGKYYPCDSCKYLSEKGVYYITDYGDSYHKSTTCKNLIRHIERVLLSGAGDKHPCSKCG